MSPPAADRCAVVTALTPAPDPVQCFQKLAHLPGCVFFDSAMRHSTLGRYSYLAADPFAWIESPQPRPQPFSDLQAALDPFQMSADPDLPPFQGGAAGLLSYDLNRALEGIAAPRFDEFGLPVLALGLYDVVLAWDHVAGGAWIISQGFPERDPSRRRRRARLRIKQFTDWISHNPPPEPAFSQPDAKTRWQGAELFEIDRDREIYSNFSKPQYLDAIAKTVEYIHAGDLFQANLAQRLLTPAKCSSLRLYLQLRRVNPAPFAGYFRGSEFEILSASPELFFQLRDRSIESRPIKGTRRRTGFPESDLIAGYELLSSEKDRSENVMIVDLMRNDLSRCCADDSIEVAQLCELERYASVLHLVSSIQGKLRPECGIVQLLESIFPGGSITGAPKIRAMEIIAELEPTARGPYCGSLGFFGFDGTAAGSILIRTITAAKNWWQIPVGGGIVAMSDPSREYEETWVKASGMLRAVQLAAELEGKTKHHLPAVQSATGY